MVGCVMVWPVGSIWLAEGRIALSGLCLLLRQLPSLSLHSLRLGPFGGVSCFDLMGCGFRRGCLLGGTL